MSLSLALRRAALLAVRDLIDAEGGGALHLYADEAMAPSPESAMASTPVAIIALAPVSFEMHATDASMVCNAIGHASARGAVTVGRFVNGLGVGVLDRTAGPPGSGAQLIIADAQDPPTAQVWAGGEVTVSHTLTEP